MKLINLNMKLINLNMKLIKCAVFTEFFLKDLQSSLLALYHQIQIRLLNVVFIFHGFLGRTVLFIKMCIKKLLPEQNPEEDGDILS